jgi:succinylglutamate desuccinylase
MKKILLLGSQHGNEILGDALYAYIKSHRKNLLPNVTYKTGNLRAKKAGVRYVESDLNRSYNGGRSTYEERRAARILQYIHDNGFDLVLDLHTTTCEQPPCFIIPDVTDTLLPLLRASSITHIVLMKHGIVRTSLIGVCPQAVSIEINKHQLGDAQMAALCDDLERYLKKKAHGAEKELYDISAPLKKTEISELDAAALKNFTLSKFGFYPVLVGENSYKAQTDYLGFKSEVMRRSRV